MYLLYICVFLYSPHTSADVTEYLAVKQDKFPPCMYIMGYILCSYVYL